VLERPEEVRVARFSGRLLAGFRLRTAVLGSVGLMIAGTTGAYAASPPSASTVDYQGSALASHVLGNPNFQSPGSLVPVATGFTGDIRNIDHDVANPAAARMVGPNALARLGGVPQVSASTLSAKVKLAANFDGLSDTQNKAVSGFHDTPPDQGLCVGFLDGFGGKVVVEVVNSEFGIYSTSGTLLSTFSMATGFADPNAFSDPRCFYDASTSSFYMTVISADAIGNTVNDLLVVNRSGAATTYQLSSSVGGTCFGDQPHTGYDSHAIYITTDEFCGTNENTFSGALLMAISKSQVAAQVATPNAVSFPLLSLGGVPILTLEPAFGNASGNEYLLNSFPFDQFGNSNSISNSLGFWTVKGDQNITTGSGRVVLSGRIIRSETYGFPQPAASTGTGLVTGNETSEAFLNPDDSRMLQVQLVNDQEQGLQLYASLNSAVNIAGDPSARDGAAWFVLDPERGRITDQGYVAVAGAYLLYPAILHTPDGLTEMTFTITSPTMNPSAAYAVRRDRGFGPVQIASAGTAAHVSFSDVLFAEARWGDYSAAELDPNGHDIWSATEYIGGNGAGDLVDNWGTRIMKLSGGK
jgi:hypothetical protein